MSTSISAIIEPFSHKYGMAFPQFGEYLHARSVLLQSDELSSEQRQLLGRAVMQEEDDWLDWKVAIEMLENWLRRRQNVIATFMTPSTRK